MRLALFLVAAALSFQLAPIGLLAASGENLAKKGADPCSSKRCQNQGVCVEQPSGHSCNCTSGFFGRNCEEGLRLVDGSSPSEGRVEVFHGGTWGSVCWGTMDMEDADVVCRQLGYGPATDISQSETFGQGSGHVGLGDIACIGSEATINDCDHGIWGPLNCEEMEYAGVTCARRPSEVPEVSDSGPREWLWLVVGSLLLGLAIAVIAFTLTKRLRRAKARKAATRRRAMEMSRRPLPPVPPVPPRATARNAGTSGRRKEAEYDVPPDDTRAEYDAPPNYTRTGHDAPPNYTRTGYDAPSHTYDMRLPAPPVPPDHTFVGTYGRAAHGDGPSYYRPDSSFQPPLPPRTFDTYGIHDRPPSDTVVTDTYCIDAIADFTRT